MDIEYHASNAPKGLDGEHVLVRWRLGKDQAGLPAVVTGFMRKSVQIAGRLDGAAVALEGRVHDALEWQGLTDAAGYPIALTTPGIWSIPGVVVEIRPVCSGGIDPQVDVGLLLVRGA